MRHSFILITSILFSLFLFIIGCIPPSPIEHTNVLLIGLQSPNCPQRDQFFVYKNDTICVTYSFWAEKGTIGMLISNKLNRPIYIDWKKCSFITGTTKHDFWDATMTMQTNGSAFIIPDWNHSWISDFSSITQITKPEKITFIPPGTTVSKSMFVIAEKDFEDIQPNQIISFDTTLVVKKHYKSFFLSGSVKDEGDSLITQKFTIPQSKFYSSTSPLSFRIYITYSTIEQFSTESYIDNSFYINQITEMPIEAFNGVKYIDSTNASTQNIWASPNSFYVYKKITILEE